MEILIILILLVVSIGMGHLGYNAARYGVTITHVLLMLLGGAVPYLVGYLIGKMR